MSSSKRQVTNPAAFTHRSLGKQVLFTVITLGFYVAYWYYITLVQLNEGTDAEYSPVLRFIGFLIPFVNLVVMWWFAQDVEAVVEQDGLLIFLAEIVFPPIVWYLVQTGINDVAQSA